VPGRVRRTAVDRAWGPEGAPRPRAPAKGLFENRQEPIRETSASVDGMQEKVARINTRVLHLDLCTGAASCL